MKLRLVLLTICLIARASAIAVDYYSYYHIHSTFVNRRGTIRDHKAQALVDGLSRWSSGLFDAYHHGGGIIVVNLQLAADRQSAQRLLGEMYSLVAHYAADG